MQDFRLFQEMFDARACLKVQSFSDHQCHIALFVAKADRLRLTMVNRDRTRL